SAVVEPAGGELQGALVLGDAEEAPAVVRALDPLRALEHARAGPPDRRARVFRASCRVEDLGANDPERRLALLQPPERARLDVGPRADLHVRVAEVDAAPAEAPEVAGLLEAPRAGGHELEVGPGVAGEERRRRAHLADPRVDSRGQLGEARSRRLDQRHEG